MIISEKKKKKLWSEIEIAGGNDAPVFVICAQFQTRLDCQHKTILKWITSSMISQSSALSDITDVNF